MEQGRQDDFIQQQTTPRRHREQQDGTRSNIQHNTTSSKLHLQLPEVYNRHTN